VGVNREVSSIEDSINCLNDDLCFKNETSGHDINHLERVFNLALRIQSKEGGDRYVIGIAALVHDYHRLLNCTPKQSLSKVKKLLEKAGVQKDKIPMILHVVEHHEFDETTKNVSDKETLIIQDADKLDAIGAIGVARTFSYGATQKVPMYEPTMPLSTNKYNPNQEDPSTIHHFYSKLLKLANNMNTKTGKKLAKHRKEFTKQFAEEFIKEWQGKK
jgi:uncharacterized protein